MEKKGSWLSAVKKVMSPKSKEKKEKKMSRLKGCFWKKKSKGLDSILEEIAAVNPAPSSPVPDVSLVDVENVRHVRPEMNTEIEQENQVSLPIDDASEQARRAYAIARATAVAAEAAAAAAQAAAEVVRLTASRSPAKSKEEIAALKIQAVFRGYMARRVLRSIKGLVRLKTLIESESVRRQTITTLICMQTLIRVQAQVCSRRIRMSEENSAFQKLLHQKLHNEFESSVPSVGENWNGSAQTKEQIEAKQQKRLEAAIKRERTLAYAFSHQQTWRNLSEPATYTFMDPDNPQWGWNRLERWMAVRPRQKQQINDTIDTKSVKTLAKRQILAPGRLSVSSPQAKTQKAISSGNVRAPGSRKSVSSLDGDAKSSQSAQSHRHRRNSVTQSSARDDESVASSSAIPSYMVPTESTKAKSRLSFENTVLAEKDSVGTTKKRFSFSTSPSTPRRGSVLN